MPWTVEHGHARTMEEQNNPPPGMMQTSGPFPTLETAMNDAAGRLHTGVTNVVVKNGDGEVVASFDAVHAHANRQNPAGE